MTSDILYKIYDELKKISDRTTRLETRFVQLGDHVGANLRVKQCVTVSVSSIGIAVEIDALDMSLSRVIAELHRQCDPERLHATAKVPVFFAGKCVATLNMGAV
jgi:hypothetical protein